EAEKSRIASTIVQMIADGRAYPELRPLPKFILYPMVEFQLRGLSQLETHRVRVRPLSAAIAEEGIEAIDLLKIDVEGAEVEVLEGIEDRDWPKIRQVVVEVESYAKRAAEVVERLRSKGFEVHAEQDSVQQAGDFGMVYALRP